MSQNKSSFGPFEILYIIMLGALLFVAVFYAGKPRIGIIDISRVAANVGMDDKILKDTAEWQKSSHDAINKQLAAYREKEKILKAKMEKAISEKDKQAVSMEMDAAAKQYKAAVREIRKNFALHRQKVMETFRLRLQPFITDVARHRKVWLVIDRSARIVYSQGRIDITDDVTAAAKTFFEKQTDLLDPKLLEKASVENDIITTNEPGPVTKEK